MAFLLLIFLSIIFSVVFITLHFLFLYFFFLKKTIKIFFSFFLSNVLCFYLAKEMNLHQIFYNFLIINFAILIIYIEFLLLIKKGFTLSIITSFKKKKKLYYKELIKSYASYKGSKWILLDRLNSLKKLKIINLNKSIKLTQWGYLLSIILIFLRRILSIRDVG